MSTKDMMLYEANRRGLLRGRQKALYEEALRRGRLNVPGAPQYAGPVSAEQMKAFAKTGDVRMAPTPPPREVVPERKSGLGKVKGRTGAAVRAATGEIAPTAGGLSAAATLATLGAGAGAATGPAAPVAVPVLAATGAIAGGLGGSRLAADAQQAVFDRFPGMAAFLGQDDEQRREDTEAYPVTTFAARLAPGLATGRPTRDLKALLGSAAVGGGAEFGMEAYNGDVDLRRVALASGAGALGAKSNALGRAVSGTPASALDEVLMAARSKSGRGVPASLEAAPVLQSVGVKPSAIDVLPDAALEEVARVAQYREPVRAAASKHTLKAVTETPGAGKRAASRAVPEMGGETSASRRAAVAEEIAKAEADALAAKPQAPEVEVAAGGRAISDRLNREYDEAYQRRSAAYKEAEAAGPAYFEDLTPDAERPRGEMAHWAPAERDGVKGYMLPTGEFKPETDVGPLGPAAVAENVRTKLNEGSHLAATAPEYVAIQRVVDKIGGARTANDLYALRRQLSDITVEAERAGNPSIAAAARTAKNALDDQMDQLAAAGRFTDEFGYPEGAAVEKWTNAIAEGRDFARQFRGNDPIEEITRREYSGGEQGPRLNPDAVTQRLLGKGPGIVLRQEGSRELAALRRRLGADSPEWQALRQEATARILAAKDPAAALAQFESKNPKAVVDMLITPEERAAIAKGPEATARVDEAKAAAERVEQAVDVGSRFNDMLAVDFRRAVQGAKAPELRDARIAMRSSIKEALKTPQQSYEYLRGLVQNEETRANIVALLGREEGAALLKRADAITERYGRAYALSPPRVVRDSPAGPSDVALGALAEGMTHGATGGGAAATTHTVARSVFGRLRGLGMSEASAKELADQVFDPAKLPEAMDRIRQLYGENEAQAFLRRLRANTAKNAGLQRAIVRVAAPASTEAIARERDAIAGEMDEEEPEAEEGVLEGDADTEGLDTSLVMQAIGGHEGTGKNPSSTARGPYQFIDSTFARYAAQVAPDLVGDADPNTSEGIRLINQKLRGTEIDGRPIEEVMMERFTEDNAEGLRGAGVPVTPATQYLAHFGGLKGALNVLKADPNASISDILDDGAIRANASIKFNGKRFAEFTAQDLIDWARDRMNHQLGRLREPPY